MTEQGRSRGAGPSVCPFVALAEDRDRRADTPDEANRCYAEPAPRRRDLSYQAEYCYSSGFPSCSVFLAWAARNAAEPAYAREAAQQAHDASRTSGDAASAHASREAADAEAPLPAPSPEGGLFGPASADEDPESRPAERFDWVSASAWADVPWDEQAEQEAAELDALTFDEPDEEEDASSPPRREEDTQAPRVPAAVPVRRRKRPQPVISARGSGEWLYSDPPGHEPLVSRRTNATPALLLAVLGLLVAALVVFMIPTLLLGGGEDGPGTAAIEPSPSIVATPRPVVTAPPAASAEPSAEPSPSPTVRPEFHTVKRGDTLTSIASRYGVRPAHLICLNNIKNRNIVVLGATYEVPPEGFRCPPGWRNQD